MIVKFRFGNHELEVPVQVEERSYLSITVHPDLKVTAKAPIDKSPESIRNRIKKKAPWIIKQLNYFEQFQPLPPERRYVSGETHYYLGRQSQTKNSRG